MIPTPTEMAAETARRFLAEAEETDPGRRAVFALEGALCQVWIDAWVDGLPDPQGALGRDLRSIAKEGWKEAEASGPAEEQIGKMLEETGAGDPELREEQLHTGIMELYDLEKMCEEARIETRRALKLHFSYGTGKALEAIARGIGQIPEAPLRELSGILETHGETLRDGFPHTPHGREEVQGIGEALAAAARSAGQLDASLSKIRSALHSLGH